MVGKDRFLGNRSTSMVIWSKCLGGDIDGVDWRFEHKPTLALNIRLFRRVGKKHFVFSSCVPVGSDTAQHTERS